MKIESTEGETLGDRSEFGAAREFFATETALEDSTHCRDEGTATSQKDTIDLCGLHLSIVEQVIDTFTYGVEFFGNPALELFASYGLGNVDAGNAKCETRLLLC